MGNEIGKVSKVKGDSVWVTLRRTSACGSCKACMASMDNEEMIIKAKNICRAKLNDFVRIDLGAGIFLTAVVIMYGVPFVSMVTGFFLGYYSAGALGYMGYRDVIGFFAGVLLAALAYLIINRFEGIWRAGRYHPSAVEIISHEK